MLWLIWVTMMFAIVIFAMETAAIEKTLARIAAALEQIAKES